MLQHSEFAMMNIISDAFGQAWTVTSSVLVMLQSSSARQHFMGAGQVWGSDHAARLHCAVVVSGYCKRVCQESQARIGNSLGYKTTQIILLGYACASSQSLHVPDTGLCQRVRPGLCGGLSIDADNVLCAAWPHEGAACTASASSALPAACSSQVRAPAAHEDLTRRVLGDAVVDGSLQP